MYKIIHSSHIRRKPYHKNQHPARMHVTGNSEAKRYKIY